MYGAQTAQAKQLESTMFENDVEMYGAQTGGKAMEQESRFENDVEMYGAQTDKDISKITHGLRMMQKCMVLKQ